MGSGGRTDRTDVVLGLALHGHKELLFYFDQWCI